MKKINQRKEIKFDNFKKFKKKTQNEEKPNLCSSVQNFLSINVFIKFLYNRFRSVQFASRRLISF